MNGAYVWHVCPVLRKSYVLLCVLPVQLYVCMYVCNLMDDTCVSQIRGQQPNPTRLCYPLVVVRQTVTQVDSFFVLCCRTLGREQEQRADRLACGKGLLL